ncbi:MULTISPECIES: phage tail sheath family protein [Clostridium]|nr:phage tail sheath family protein [Clostridium sp.]MDU4479769.1 phage tail sheath family protein [Clostridium sp.]CAI3616270.1 conserved hypothetical protein [Clostridium neonatale]
MSGGTWSKQDKVRAGAYINFKSKNKETNLVNDRGTVGLPLVLPFGPEKKIIEIDNDTDLFASLGLEKADESVLMLKEALKKAQKVLLYRLNEGTKATKTVESLTVSANWGGTKGNSIKVVIQTNVDEPSSFDVITYLGDTKFETQTVKTINELAANEFVKFSGTGAPTLTAGFNLEGGTDGTATAKDYTDFLKQLELYNFHAVAIPFDDSSTKLVVKEFIKRLREDEGKRVQAVLPNYKEADYEGIISVKNGVFIENNIQIDKVKATAYIAALTASASYSTSNTYKSYEGAIDVDTRYTDKEIKEIINDGEIVFVNTIVNNQPKIIIEQDINTFKTFTDDKDKSFKKNRVIRTLDGINNRIKARWEEAYIGNEDNTEDGRNLFKKDILKILETLQSDGAIKSVAIDDIEVLEGESIESVVANVAVQPVDAMEKLYMTVFI